MHYGRSRKQYGPRGISGHNNAEILKHTGTQVHVFTDPSWRSSWQKRQSGTCRIISFQFCIAALRVFNTRTSIMLSSEEKKVQSSNRLEYHRWFVLCLPRLSLLQHAPPEGSSSQFCASDLVGFRGEDKGSPVHLFSMKPAITCLLRMLSLLS